MVSEKQFQIETKEEWLKLRLKKNCLECAKN